jgi:hypothetical protein
MTKNYMHWRLVPSFRVDAAVALSFWMSIMLCLAITVCVAASALSYGTSVEVAVLVIPVLVSFCVSGIGSSRFIAGTEIPVVAKCLLVFALSLIAFLAIPVFFGLVSRICVVKSYGPN